MPDEQHDSPEKITPEHLLTGEASINQYRAQEGVTRSPYCTTTPVPGTHLTPATLAAPCPDCEHATALHVGVDHCPVCEMVDLNQRARAATASTDMTVNISADADATLAEKAWAEVQRRHRLGLPRAGFKA